MTGVRLPPRCRTRPENRKLRGHHLHLDLGRVRVPGACPGPVLPADRRLVDGRPSALRARRRRARDGARAPSPRLRPRSPQRSRAGQYTAVLFTKRCAKAGIEVSMGSVGDCYDNAVCETFHASLKKERIYRQSWPTPRSGPDSRVRVHRGLVQPAAPALHARLRLPDRVRTTAHRARPTGARGLDPRHSIGRGRFAENRRRAYNAPPLDGRRRVRCRRLELSRERPSCANPVPLRPRGRQSRDERHRVASPLGSQGTSSLIQTSTTTGKTCRPNRGRSISTAVLRGPRAVTWEQTLACTTVYVSTPVRCDCERRKR